MNPRAKFRANIRNNKRAIGDKLNSRWRPRHLEFITIATFGHNGLFPVVTGYTAAKFH